MPLQLGLSTLQRIDPVKEASQLIENLAQETNQSVAIAVWGNLGPTIVRLEEPIQRIDALCAPVFDTEGHIVLGILAMGPTATFDSNWDGAVAKALKRCATEVSRRIGRTVAAGR